MAEPYLGEIRMFGGNFAPQGWALCNGQLLSIADNDALFNLLGTTYGGDGQNTFGLPNMQGRIPVHPGGSFSLGQQAGTETVTLATTMLPSHSHALMAASANGQKAVPTSAALAAAGTNIYSSPGAPAPMAAAIGPAGGSQPHDNMQPFQCLNFIISLQGVFPSQN